MIMIQDDPMPTGADKPLRITGDPHKVQVGLRRAQYALLSFQFTLNFTHFMPPVFHSKYLKTSLFLLNGPFAALHMQHFCSFYLLLMFVLPFFLFSFLASP